MTVRSEEGDEVIDVAEFEDRVKSGELSPQTLVNWPTLTGESFIQACELEMYQRLHEPRRAYFQRAFRLSKFPWLTSGLILVNIAVFLATQRNGTLSIDDMVLYGGKVSPLIGDLGQLYRLLTANVLHRDAVHLGLNMFVFFNVGGVLENTYRTLDYLWLLVLTGIATFATSMLINDSITVGASGMVFGCLGGLVAFGITHRSLLPAQYRNLLGDAPIPTAGGFLLIGLSSLGVDNGAHIGGLVVGIITGLWLRPRLLAETRHFWWEPGLRALPSLGLLALVIFGETIVGDALPRWRIERDENFGLAVPMPKGWSRGANVFGSRAWYNGLSGTGRATFAAESIDMPEGADAAEAARQFLEVNLQPQALGPDVSHVTTGTPVTVTVGDRDAVKVSALIESTEGPQRLTAYFVPRGRAVFRLVFSWSAEYPRYGHVFDRMVQGLKFEESRSLRLARAQALIFPGSPQGQAAMGREFLDEGNAANATEALSAAIRAEPSNVEVRALLARAWLEAGDVEMACQTAAEAMAYSPSNVAALEADARCEVARGNNKRALDRLEEARILAPGNASLKAAWERLRAAQGP